MVINLDADGNKYIWKFCKISEINLLQAAKKKSSMSSWKSSSSKSVLELDGMLDFEDQLDYEPDGVESEDDNSDNDTSFTRKEVESSRETSEEEEPDKEENNYVQEEDSEVQVPEPSGLEDFTNLTTSSERQSLSYEDDLERAPSESRSITPSDARTRALSATPSFRDKMNYKDLHIDVEEGSFRSKYGHYLKKVDLKFLNSSSSEDEEENFHSTLNKKGAFKGKIGQQNNLLYENYASSRKKYENMVSPRDIIAESVESEASTMPVDMSEVPIGFKQGTERKTSISLQETQASIATGNVRDFSPTIQDNYINSPRSKQATVTSENRRDISPNLEQVIQNKVVYSPQGQQSKFAGSLRGQQITVRNESRNHISHNLEQETQKRIVDLPLRKQTIIVTRNRKDISPTIGNVTQKSGINTQRTKSITIKTDDRSDVSSDSEQNIQNDVMNSPGTKQTVVVNNRRAQTITKPDCSSSDKQKLALSPRRERNRFNFKIQVAGDKRIFIQPEHTIVKKPPKPWKSAVEDYMDDSNVVLLSSEDKVMECLPEATKTGVKSRLNTYPENESYSSESSAGFSGFKVPLKRPPTRLKGSGKNISVSVDLKSQQWQVKDVAPPTVSQKDDIISIMAGSDVSLADDLDGDRINEFVVKEEPTSLPGSSLGTEQRKLERTAQWINQALEPRRQQQVVPSIYKGLCYKYFLNANCSDMQCQRSHMLISPHTHIDQLPFLSFKQLREAYVFATDNFFLYRQIYKHFANAFAVKDLKGELIKMINIIFEESCYQIRPEEGLEVVLSALQKTNLTSFKDTVEYLLMHIGLKRYPTLGNLLFEIILNKPDVSEHWPITRKLVIAGEKMNLKQGSKFLVHLMKSPVNLKVCQEVYRHILMCKFVDLPTISPDIRQQFLKTCSQETIVRETADIEANIDRNLRKERFNYERTQQGNDHISILPLQEFSMPLLSTAGRTHLPISSSYVPQREFGGSSSNEPDFASLNRQGSLFAPQTLINDQAFDSSSIVSSFLDRRSDDDRQSQTNESFHDVDFRYPPPVIRKQGHNNNGSSDGDHSPQFSDSESSVEQTTGYINPGLLGTRKRHAPAPPAMMYNREGLHYDPANDYIHPPKKRIAEPINEFDRLKVSNGTLLFDIDEEAVYRQTQDDKETRPVLHRANNRARLMVQRRPSFEDEATARATLEPHYDYEETSGLKPNQENPPGAKPVLHKRKFFGEATEPVSHTPNPVFHRRSAEVEKESSFPRPSDVVEETRQVINRLQDTDQRVRSSRHKPQHQNIVATDEDLRCQDLRARRGMAAASTRRIELNVSNSEAAVSSSSDAKLSDDKPPEHPQFGKMYFDPHYRFNISLHNLYLEAIDNVDIDEEDVHKLNDCVKSCNGRTFLELIEKYKGPKTVQNFISMTLANLKGMNQMIARTYQGLLDTIEEENPIFYKNRYIRVILEVITMNLLFELNHRNMIAEAYMFLNKFSDWDSLVTSRIFVFNTHGISIIGRYLFIAKLLVHSAPELTFEILVCPTLHLLGKYEKWPYKPSCPIPEIFTKDLNSRNTAISMFLKKGYLLNPLSVIQFYKAAFQREIWKFDVKTYVNPMMMDLVNKNHTFLKLFIAEINKFQKHMTTNILRAFLICLCLQGVSNNDLFLVYEECVERGIYQRLVGVDKVEYTIEIRTNMHAHEIELIIKYYFQKLEEIKRVPPGSEPLRFHIKLPGDSLCYKSLPILNTNKSLSQTNDILKIKLETLFSISSTCLQPGIVEVKKEELVNYLDRSWI